MADKPMRRIVFSNKMITAGIRQLMEPGNTDAETVIEIYRAMAVEDCEEPQGLIELLSETRSQLFAMNALVEKYEERLEIVHEWGGDEHGEYVKIPIPKGERGEAIDGIACRDATIGLLKSVIDSQAEHTTRVIMLLSEKTLGPIVVQMAREISALREERDMLKADVAELTDKKQ